ncbi:MAG TPA: hypothetical protein VGY54_12440 [Polyangiaceae bacterium]|jgi:hypothetical protein|nr:hypothetical protein [Polyangiaceae bacterium]
MRRATIGLAAFLSIAIFSATAAAQDAGPAKEGGTDHDLFVGRFAVGYLGIADLPTATAMGAAARLPAPVIGGRYWLQRNLGIDAGLGLGWTSGSTDANVMGVTTSVDTPGNFGLALHGGVPLALAHAKHFTFEVVPETTLGFTSGTIKGVGGAPDTSLSGFHWDIGGRVGAEVHFGFIGIPQLALEGTVGLYFQRESVKASAGPNSVSTGTNSITTKVFADPWAIFAQTVHAFYYF